MTSYLAFRAFAIAAITSGLVMASEATSIVAIRSPTTIVLGGDSKLATGDGAEAGLICKVGLTKNIAYGESGILWVPTRGFTASDIVKHALGEKGNISSRVTAFDNAIRQPLIRLGTELKQTDPEGYRKLVKDKNVFAIVFATVEDHIPKMMMLFYAASEQNGKVILTTTRYNCPGDCKTDAGFVTLGEREAAQADITAHPSIWSDLGLEGAVRHLIQDEIAAKPDDVGLPIVIIRLSDGITEWVEGQDQCRHKQAK